MKDYKFQILTVIFLFMVIISALLCEEFYENRYIIFYTMGVPSMLGLGVCWYITAIMYMNNDKR